jgi:hypothetical protein
MHKRLATADSVIPDIFDCIGYRVSDLQPFMALPRYRITTSFRNSGNALEKAIGDRSTCLDIALVTPDFLILLHAWGFPRFNNLTVAAPPF